MLCLFCHYNNAFSQKKLKNKQVLVSKDMTPNKKIDYTTFYTTESKDIAVSGDTVFAVVKTSCPGIKLNQYIARAYILKDSISLWSSTVDGHGSDPSKDSAHGMTAVKAMALFRADIQNAVCRNGFFEEPFIFAHAERIRKQQAKKKR